MTSVDLASVTGYSLESKSPYAPVPECQLPASVFDRPVCSTSMASLGVDLSLRMSRGGSPQHTWEGGHGLKIREEERQTHVRK